MAGILDAILGTNASSPTDALIQHILGMGNEADPGMSGDTQNEDLSTANTPAPQGKTGSGSLNEIFGMPPEVAAKVTANPTQYPNLAAVLGQKQTKVTPRKPLDYLLAAASPVIAGLANMGMAHRRSDRKMAFFSGLASGGLQSIENEASRPDRMKAADRQRQIEDILLQKTVRGTPISGVDPSTGQPVYKYPGTGESVPGIGPQPRAPRPVETREVTDKDGNKTLEQLDPTTGTWKAAQMEVPDTGKPGSTKRVPFTSPKQAEKPLRELRVGSDVAGAKKGTETDQYYWVEQGKDPVPSGLYRSLSDRPTREGDINRAEKHQANQWAVKALADAHNRLGPGKKPEDYANAATETFRQAAGTNKDLASKSSEVSTAIRNIGRSVKSEDELAQLVTALLGDQTKK